MNEETARRRGALLVIASLAMLSVALGSATVFAIVGLIVITWQRIAH